MKRKLMDYIRAESQCNYSDILDYFNDINNLGSDKLKADALGELVWFIAMEQDRDDKSFEIMYGEWVWNWINVIIAVYIKRVSRRFMN